MESSIISLKNELASFKENKLLFGADQMLDALDRQINSCVGRIQFAKEFAKLNEEGDEIFSRIQKLHEAEQAKNF